jgi:16S rRNA (cytidine1402-2'-O)-methyltransferase
MLFVVSTPIGNLGDVTLRAIETLKTCDGIICEDTRVTGQLLKHLNVEKKEMLSYHGYSDEGRVAHIVTLLKAGKNLALVSDAGTPGISDPGSVIVAKAKEAGVQVEVIPGPSAFLAALSGSGLAIHQFTYLGFLPLKKGRQTLLNSFKEEERTVVFYESVHRIERALTDLAEVFREQPERVVVVARELTKMHEEIVRTTVKDLPQVAKDIVKKGEFVVVIGGR